MSRKVLRAGFLGRLVAAAAVGVTLMSGVAVTSAQASGSCTPSERGALWLTTHTSLRLVRTAGCTYYARYVETDWQYSAGVTVNVRVERREGGSITAWRQINIAGPYGEYNTTAVDGWWAGAASQDQHHACYAVEWGPWTCTGWVDV